MTNVLAWSAGKARRMVKTGAAWGVAKREHAKVVNALKAGAVAAATAFTATEQVSMRAVRRAACIRARLGMRDYRRRGTLCHDGRMAAWPAKRSHAIGSQSVRKSVPRWRLRADVERRIAQRPARSGKSPTLPMRK
eukprot:3107120-Pleurochrysis_carterae.AAC.2